MALPPAPMPPLLPVEEIERRLTVIFPVGVPAREYITRLNTVRTVFAALYIGAVEGADRWLAPRHIYRMRPELAAIEETGARLAYYERVPPSGEGGWYADNSREGARDEGVRRGLIPLNAMIVLPGVSTTSSRGRYALSASFASLFEPGLAGEKLSAAAAAWRRTYLSGAALARAALVQDMDTEGVEVFLPQGGSVLLPAGDSPRMTKHVIEIFAKTFLAKPAVVWISDSREKLFRDDRLVRAMQIELDVARLLPDIILVDLDPPGHAGSLLVVFVEVVFSDGSVDEERRAQLWKLLASSPRNYLPQDAAFVSVYTDRGARAASRAVRELAWRSFAWFVSEPEHLVQFHDAPPRTLSSLLWHGPR
jgi:BsuBI/PstI restriction endonuclease domain/BsuBI/PstI restriction endonuclease HTH domain